MGYNLDFCSVNLIMLITNCALIHNASHCQSWPWLFKFQFSHSVWQHLLSADYIRPQAADISHT